MGSLQALRLPSLFRILRVLAAIVLLGACLPAGAFAQTVVKVNFKGGFIGTIGQNTGKANAIHLFSTMGFIDSTFEQVSTTGVFGGTQGNDRSGVLRLYRADGTHVAIPGALNWRITTNGKVDYFGYIPDPANAPITITWPGGSLVLNATSNYGAQIIGSTLSFAEGSNVSGNAAASGLIASLNDYLAVVTASAPKITGPGGVAGAAASTISVPENQTGVTGFTASEAVTWSITGGTDAARVSINPATGALTFLAPPDYELPTDADGNRTYVVIVTAMDADRIRSSQTLTVTVTDVFETPQITTSKTVNAVGPPAGFDCALDAALPMAGIAIPGTCVEYTVTVRKSPGALASAQDVTLVDRMPSGIVFVALRSSTGFSSVVLGAASITAVVNSLPAGATATFVFRAILS
ncbi:cadherin repeat domain-containing protein [Cereibacter sphaeroides]|uniref:cadherin repeat domain-containing protein n=1 Tax=Cereibacter sphaeroides TaxID=1063 RepID=UPI001F4199C8|nr:cadherin repeat domain-containing protein [Cereibacter sphaeroides]MCE6958747.1 cadherin repeat domain-containing protein [Cereibacter sphaeroides]MCE6973379.1 cadherin repeat domain-containing protein [Cereibacter sphaeroides]